MYVFSHFLPAVDLPSTLSSVTRVGDLMLSCMHDHTTVRCTSSPVAAARCSLASGSSQGGANHHHSGTHCPSNAHEPLHGLHDRPLYQLASCSSETLASRPVFVFGVVTFFFLLKICTKVNDPRSIAYQYTQKKTNNISHLFRKRMSHA